MTLIRHNQPAFTRVLPHNSNRVFLKTKSGGGSGPAPAAAFWALTPDEATYEMLGVRTGTGVLASTHTSDLYAPDFEGVQRLAAANEPVWSGGRVVANIFFEVPVTAGPFDSSDMTTMGTSWVAPTDATTINWPAGGTTLTTFRDPTSVPVKVGQILVFRFTLLEGTTAQLSRIIYDGVDSGGSSVSLDLSSYSYPQVITLSSVASADGSFGDISFDNRSSHGGDGLGGIIKITDFQIEVLDSGASAIPGEYLQYVDTVAGAEKKVYANGNGNTVASNAVTEAVGTPLTEAPYLQYYPAATNEMLNSGDAGTESITVTPGTWSINCIVNGLDVASCIVTAGTATATGYGTATPGSLIELDVTVGGTISIENTGDILCCNLINKTIAEVRGLGPIFTTTAAVSTDRTVYSFDLVNMPLTSGALYFENEFSIDSNELALVSNMGLVSTFNSSEPCYLQQALTINTYGGAVVANATAWNKGDLTKVGIPYSQGDNKVDVNVNGTYATEEIFSTFRTGLPAIEIGNGGVISTKIRNLRRYDITSYAEGKTIIDGLMT